MPILRPCSQSVLMMATEEDPYGATPLLLACVTGCAQVVQLLLEARADKDSVLPPEQQMLSIRAKPRMTWNENPA